MLNPLCIVRPAGRTGAIGCNRGRIFTIDICPISFHVHPVSSPYSFNWFRLDANSRNT